MNSINKPYTKAKQKSLLHTLALMVSAVVVLNGAILDDLVDNINHHIEQKNPHKRHHRRHHHYRISDEKKWQTALQFLGYYQGKIDGDLYTTESFNAINAFQHKRQELATGFLEEQYKTYLSHIYQLLRLQEYLEYRGKNRRKNRQKIQAALTIEGYYSGKIDGAMGRRSKRSILLYQNSLDSNATASSKLDPEEKTRLVEDAVFSIEKQLAAIKDEENHQSIDNNNSDMIQ